MTTRAANEFPGAEHAPLDYPGLRPEYSYVYHRGDIFRLAPDGDSLSRARLVDRDGTSSDENPCLDDFLRERGAPTLSQRHAILSVGSNGCPGRLAEKYPVPSEVAVPVFYGTISDVAVVYSRAIVSYGALAATFLVQPGARSRLSVTMLTDDELARMDATESNYERISLSQGFRVQNGPVIEELTAYLDRRLLTYQDAPVLVDMMSDGGTLWRPAKTEREVLSLAFDQAGLLPNVSIEERHQKLVADRDIQQSLQAHLDSKMSALAVDEKGALVGEPLKCLEVERTVDRPNSQGTYIVRLSGHNRKRLGVHDGSYVGISYKNMSAVACLSVDDHLDDQTIRMDQTHRVALGIESVLQGTNEKRLVYSKEPNDQTARDGELDSPIRIKASGFRGPRLLQRLLRFQYLLCRVHTARNVDMEKPVSRLPPDALQIVGIKPGDQVQLISDSETVSIRCFEVHATRPDHDEFPGANMEAYPSPLKPASDKEKEPALAGDSDSSNDYQSTLPWCTIDFETRKRLGVKPWDVILVGRSVTQALMSELQTVSLAIVLSLVGVAITLPKELIPQDNDYARPGLVGLGLVAILGLIIARIRSRV